MINGTGEWKFAHDAILLASSQLHTRRLIRQLRALDTKLKDYLTNGIVFARAY